MNKILRVYVIVSLCLLGFMNMQAGEIKGHVYDKDTKEQIVGAVVVIKAINVVSVTEVDGSYHFKKLQPGEYTLTIEYIGYKATTSTIVIKDNSGEIKNDIYLPTTLNELKEVDIKGKANGATDAFASNKEKNSINIMNIVSAKTMQLSPDILVSEVMQRVSGVSMEKGNGGQGQYAIIRGMDRRYNTTLINGVKIPSPDNRDRFVPLDMFPAELLERLEVIKSLTPSMEGDATGGVLNMVMKNAPDHLMIEANVGFGSSGIFQNRNFDKFDHSTVSVLSPAQRLGPGNPATLAFFPYQNLQTSQLNAPLNTNIGLTLGNRYFNNKLGVVIAGSYQNTYDGYNASVLLEDPTTKPISDGTKNNYPGFEELYVRRYSTLSQRSGLVSKVDYQFNNKNTISLFGTYLQLNEYRVRNTVDSVHGGFDINNYAGVNAIKYRTETRTNLQGIYNLTLQGKHQLTDRLSTDWSLVVSEAKKDLPDVAQYGYNTKVSPVYDSPQNANIPYKTGHYDYTSFYPTTQSRQWMHNTDDDQAIYINLHYNSNYKWLPLIEAGGMYRHKYRNNIESEYNLSPTSVLYTSLPETQYTWENTNTPYGHSTQNAGTYNFTEDLLEYYGQATIELGSLKMLGGVRAEHTNQSYSSSLDPSQPGKYGSYSYIDILPSIQAKYNFTNTAGLRGSYFRSIYRPAYADLIPFPDQNADELYPVKGNDTLQHSVIDNADLRFEYFPQGLDQYMVGVFYKQIQNPVEYATVPETKTQLYKEPGNFGTATNYGIELGVRKYLGTFGLSGNYTYTHSDINSTKIVYLDPPYNNQYVSQHRPLQGQAAHVGNLSLLYKNSRNKIDAQLAFIYVGDRINSISLYRGLDIWEKPTFKMDFSINKQFGNHFTVYFKYKNILNTGSQFYIKHDNLGYIHPDALPFQESPDYYTVERDHFYSSILIGLRWKL